MAESIISEASENICKRWTTIRDSIRHKPQPIEPIVLHKSDG